MPAEREILEWEVEFPPRNERRLTEKIGRQIQLHLAIEQIVEGMLQTVDVVRRLIRTRQKIRQLRFIADLPRLDVGEARKCLHRVAPVAGGEREAMSRLQVDDTWNGSGCCRRPSESCAGLDSPSSKGHSEREV